jgi:hypothetical protein
MKIKLRNNISLIYIFLAVVAGMVVGNYLLKKDYWSGVYYPSGNLVGNAIYSPKFDSKEECIGWAINERGKRPQDSDVPLQDLWECNKNCKLESNYKYLVDNSPSSILERNDGPLYLCDDGGFDGGDWMRGDF